LHAAARNWLERQGFFSADDLGLSNDAVFLELTKKAKLSRIAQAGCTFFIDDLAEFLAEPEFPVGARRILFDPAGVHSTETPFERARSWADIRALIFPAGGDSELGAEKLPAAAALFAKAGMGLNQPPVRIAGGANNRVFKAENGRGEKFLLKEYFHNPADVRNRFESERLFYELAAVVAPSRTPRAFGWDEVSRLGLFEFVDGRRLRAGEVGVSELDAALALIRDLNKGRNLVHALRLPLAAEACFTLEAHCRTVERRIEQLKSIPAVSPLDAEARDFVFSDLTAVWPEIRFSVFQGGPTDDPLTEENRCVSPSDFGFHNCIRRGDGSLVFVDFEYAGWDDPAKTVCDMFCQPEVPVPAPLFDRFAAGVSDALALGDGICFFSRCRRLLPVYKMKWCCIMLNEFVRSDRGRRAFALGADGAEARKARQLAAARQALSALRTNFVSKRALF
jgi:hypothetical protein